MLTSDRFRGSVQSVARVATGRTESSRRGEGSEKGRERGSKGGKERGADGKEADKDGGEETGVRGPVTKACQLHPRW